MIRILLACGIGASTGFMAANMRKAAKAQKLDVTIHAVSKSQVAEYADRIDVLALIFRQRCRNIGRCSKTTM